MRCEEVVESVKFVLKKEDMWRFYVCGSDDLQLYFDPHGMSVKNAKRNIRNIIAISPFEFSMTIIHGYNNGTAIKDMIQTDTISNRIVDKEEVPNNDGRTVLKVKSRCA